MADILTWLREFHFGSCIFRLLLALAIGGLLGYGRKKKERNAGLRTYMLVCVGAALTVIISLYENEMLGTQWAYAQAVTELRFDGTRFSAGVISGIGFLAAGAIIGTEHQQVSGLTSAIGLFTAACVGIAAGAGFYECVLAAAVLIVFAMETLQPVEIIYKRRLRNITIFVEFDAPEDLDRIEAAIREQGAQIFDIDLEGEARTAELAQAVIFSLRLDKHNASHSAMLSSLAELPCVSSVRELIS